MQSARTRGAVMTVIEDCARHWKQWVVIVGVVGGVLIAGGRPASARPYHLVEVVPDFNPAILTSFDISWVDPTTETYYLADRSNKSIDSIKNIRKILDKSQDL